MNRQQLCTVTLVIALIFAWNVYSSSNSLVFAYSPIIDHHSIYNYGFINVLNNQTAAEIDYWTNLILPESNYTMNWHQLVNLSIRVAHLVPIGPIIQAYYNFSVTIFRNVVTVFNNTWQTIVSFNGSVPAPAPTGISSGLVDYPITEGLPGFFLDVGTLSVITTGSNVIIGESLWQMVSHTTITLGSSPQLCYQLFNSSSSSNQQITTTYIIDQDVGIYYQANETTVVTVGSTDTSITYYYQVLTTNISLIPPPSPLPIFIIVATVIVVVVGVAVLLLRRLWLHRKQDS